MTESNLPQAFKPDFFDEIEFKFEILSLSKKTIQNQSNVIVSVTWKLTGIYNNIVEDHTCNAAFSEIQLQSQESFIDYNNLTEDIVKSWVMQDDLLDNIKCSIANKINLLTINTTEDVTEFPWS